jgi:hypothetical protein
MTNTKFIEISKEEIENSMSYIIATVILNQKNEFTIDDIYTKIKEICIEKNIKQENIYSHTIEKLFMLRDNGVVIEHGSYFSIIKNI